MRICNCETSHCNTEYSLSHEVSPDALIRVSLIVRQVSHCNYSLSQSAKKFWLKVLRQGCVWRGESMNSSWVQLLSCIQCMHDDNVLMTLTVTSSVKPTQFCCNGSSNGLLFPKATQSTGKQKRLWCPLFIRESQSINFDNFLCNKHHLFTLQWNPWWRTPQSLYNERSFPFHVTPLALQRFQLEGP
jgi:hypothetical protein